MASELRTTKSNKGKPVMDSLAEVMRDGDFKSVEELFEFIKEKYKNVDFK